MLVVAKGIRDFWLILIAIQGRWETRDHCEPRHPTDGSHGNMMGVIP